MSGWMGFQWILLLLAAPAAGYFLRARKQGRTQTAYCIILIFGYLWALGQHLENSIYLYRPEENTYRAALYLCYLGMCVLGPACVYLSWCYSGKYRFYRDKVRTAALFGTGALFYLAILTNDLHIYTTPGSASPDGATACCSTPSPCCPMGALSMPILLCSG